MRQPIWSPFEVALLIDTYWQVENRSLTKKEAVITISNALRTYATNKGLQIDDTFRNANGISMRFEELRFLFTGGRSGIKNTSNLFRIMVKMRQENPDAFQEILSAAKSMFQQPEEPVSQLPADTSSCQDILSELKDIEVRRETLVSYMKEKLPDYVQHKIVDWNNATLQNAVICVDLSLLNSCLSSPNQVIIITNALRRYTIETKKEIDTRNRIVDALSCIPQTRLRLRFLPFLYAYSSKQEQIDKLVKHCESDWSLQELALRFYSKDELMVSDVVLFLKWCSIDFDLYVNRFVESIYKNDREKYVIQMRAQNQSLNAIGEKLGITRERVRQIEQKTRSHFSRWLKQRILLLVVALNNGGNVLDNIAQRKLFKDNTMVMKYLFATTPGKQHYTYEKNSDVIIITCPWDNQVANNFEQVKLLIANMPDIFGQSELETYIADLQTLGGLDRSLLQQMIENEYSLTGKVYHRFKLRLRDIYAIVIEKYYPNGIHLDDVEIDSFRKNIATEFGNIELPETNRAIISVIQRICILCDRGKYQLRDSVGIPIELCEKIFNFIQDSTEVIFLTNTLFETFEDELLAAGITNKYFLQGVMREQYGDHLVITRDYISKDKNITSIYSAITNYIREFDYPISKDQIMSNFPGLTEIVFSFAISSGHILNYFGYYIHDSRLLISSEDIRYFISTIQKLLAENLIIHNKAVYNCIRQEQPEILERLYIKFAIQLYSVLEHYCCDHYSFQRPYIAALDTEINHISERLNAMIDGLDIVSINTISEFFRNNHYQLYSLISYLNSLNDRYLITNTEEIIAISKTGINEEIIREIEEQILNEIDGCAYVAELKCIHQFPTIKVPWSEWLIYSALNKWSTALEVSTSSNQFRYATPLVAPIGKMDLSIVSEEERYVPKSVVLTDDLDQIDDLIADYIDDEVDIGEDLLQYEL